MMAFDRTPTQPNLNPDTVDALRSTLRRSVADGSHADELHDLLCRTADEARTKGIQAERLLIVLKDIWYGLPEVAAASSAEHANVLLQQLISRCIHEYYSL